ncbi:hypothetical protein QCE63_04895 [Caballeronia sp. LZ065]|uniref:hypothetical protein n=1 Tax=Caballeronia sp. LZ065 TaxID=3038571 RepID=UPI0028578AE9|nr:hypothetical protein [Caballeronia sp. LZ065]MDR5778768.1 hypothetical protein [Caballeronia sp. LZ065]
MRKIETDAEKALRHATEAAQAVAQRCDLERVLAGWIDGGRAPERGGCGRTSAAGRPGPTAPSNFHGREK